jgi:hypothetical protein
MTGKEESMLDNYIPLDYNDPNCVKVFEEGEPNPERQDICPAQLDIYYLKEADMGVKSLTKSLAPDSLWVFNETRLSELKGFIKNISGFSITYYVAVTYPFIDSKVNSCFNWTI